MVARLLIALGLMALCVAIHASGVTTALRWTRRQADATGRFWPMTWRLVRVEERLVFERGRMARMRTRPL